MPNNISIEKHFVNTYQSRSLELDIERKSWMRQLFCMTPREFPEGGRFSEQLSRAYATVVHAWCIYARLRVRYDRTISLLDNLSIRKLQR